MQWANNAFLTPLPSWLPFELPVSSLEETILPGPPLASEVYLAEFFLKRQFKK
jgi:hypothetical protein